MACSIEPLGMQGGGMLRSRLQWLKLQGRAPAAKPIPAPPTHLSSAARVQLAAIESGAPRYVPGRWSSLHARVQQSIRSRGLIEPAASLLIAVSGGQDSLALAALLMDLSAASWRWRLAIVHCDHGWRTDSAANATHVQALAHSWGLPCFTAVADTVPGTEALAREWRYSALADIALQQGFSHVATGHTASDRAETLLLNLARGSGIDGLAALCWSRPLDLVSSSCQAAASSADSALNQFEHEAPAAAALLQHGNSTLSMLPSSASADVVQPPASSSTITLIRPLLELTREETGTFCSVRALHVWEDSTNADVQYRRNRMRLQLLPLLRQHFNPRVDQALARTAEALSEDVEFLEDQASDLLKQALLPAPPIAVHDHGLVQLSHSAASPAGPGYVAPVGGRHIASRTQEPTPQQQPQQQLSWAQAKQEQQTPVSAPQHPLTSAQARAGGEAVALPSILARRAMVPRQASARALQHPALDRTVLSAAPIALQRRALRQWLSSVYGGSAATQLTAGENECSGAPYNTTQYAGIEGVGVQISFDAIERVRALVKAPNRTRTDTLLGQVSAVVEGHTIILIAGGAWVGLVASSAGQL